MGSLDQVSFQTVIFLFVAHGELVFVQDVLPSFFMKSMKRLHDCAVFWDFCMYRLGSHERVLSAFSQHCQGTLLGGDNFLVIGSQGLLPVFEGLD